MTRGRYDKMRPVRMRIEQVCKYGRIPSNSRRVFIHVLNTRRYYVVDSETNAKQARQCHFGETDSDAHKCISRLCNSEPQRIQAGTSISSHWDAQRHIDGMSCLLGTSFGGSCKRRNQQIQVGRWQGRGNQSKCYYYIPNGTSWRGMSYTRKHGSCTG